MLCNMHTYIRTPSYFLSSTGFKGKKCECDIKNPDSNNQKCKATNGKYNPDGIECSENGKCKCGKCVCDNEHVGEFCNCLKEDCPKTDSGKICGGKIVIK